jgi:acyl-CoA synthetase (NDP forming)
MTDADTTAEVVVRMAAVTNKPIIASFMGEARVRSAIEKLKAGSIPNFSFPELAVKSFQRLAKYRAWRNTTPEETPPCRRDFAAAREAVNAILDSGTFRAGEEEAIQILSCYGFRFPKHALVRTSREAGRTASEIGFPLVMKISSPDILHKTDVGGVHVNVRTPREAEDAFVEITSNARRIMPDAFIRGVTISEMVQGGKEVILGVTYDRTFGHMLMFGLGGIYVEVLKDVSFRIAPVTRRDALAMVTEIKTGGLLRSARGERPADMDAIADAIVNLSCLVSDFPEIRELDVNPLAVMEQGAVALDVRIIFKQMENKR